MNRKGKVSQCYRRYVRRDGPLALVFVMSHGRRAIFYFKNEGKGTSMFRVYQGNTHLMTPVSSQAFNELYEREVLRDNLREEIWQVCKDEPESIQFAITSLLREADKCDARRAAVEKLKCQTS